MKHACGILEIEEQMYEGRVKGENPENLINPRIENNGTN